MRINRFSHNPIIHPGLHPSLGSNINGPSLVKVPSWVDNPLGRYYLYFAHHKGAYIRLAHADAIGGPWTVHEPGTLHLEDSHFSRVAAPRSALAGMRTAATAESDEDRLTPHVASPEIYVDDARRALRMYYHGMREDGSQRTRVALSRDGLRFEARPPTLSLPYLRVFDHEGMVYGIAMPGRLYRSEDGLQDFEEGPTLFEPTMRHCAVHRVGDTLRVFWSRVGDAPEHILCSRVSLAGDWQDWRASPPEDVLFPERPFEGATQPVEPSLRGAINHEVNQLRDPCIHEEDGRIYLLYSVAGERGIAVAEIERW